MKKILLLGVILALVAVLVVPMAAFAATGTTQITGTVAQTIALTQVPGTFSLDLVPGTSPESENKTVTVKANHVGWTLTVKEAGGSPDGKMAKADATPLANAMQVKGGEQESYETLLDGAAVTLVASGNATSESGRSINDIKFKQQVTWADLAGDYSITVTFTATPAV